MARVRIEKGRANLVDQKNLEPADTEALLVRSQPSIEVSRNAKGGFSYTVKVYADSADDALAEAMALAKKLDKEFPVEQ